HRSRLFSTVSMVASFALTAARRFSTYSLQITAPPTIAAAFKISCTTATVSPIHSGTVLPSPSVRSARRADAAACDAVLGVGRRKRIQSMGARQYARNELWSLVRSAGPMTSPVASNSVVYGSGDRVAADVATVT